MAVGRITLAMIGVAMLVVLIIVSANCDNGSNVINDAITVDFFRLIQPLVK